MDQEISIEAGSVMEEIMEQALPQVALTPVAVSDVVDSRRASARAIVQRAPAPAIAVVWRATMIAFSTHCLPILTAAIAGFAGVRMLTATFASAVSPGLLSVIAAITGAFTQGCIVLVVLRPISQRHQDPLCCSIDQSVEQHIHSRHGWQIVLSRWPALLAGCLVYSTFLTIAQSATPASVLALQSEWVAPAAPSPATSGVAELYSLGRRLFDSTVQALLPAPEIPLATILGLPDAASHQTLRPPVCYGARPTGPGINQDRLEEYIATHCADAAAPFDGAVAAIVLALIIVTETLLRFRVVAAFSPAATGMQSGIFGALMYSARVAWSHFAIVTKHVWVLRLAIITAQVLFISFPLLVVQRYIVPTVPHYVPGMAWLAPAMSWATLCGLAIVNSLAIAFSTVYDAQLYVAVQNHTLTEKTIGTR